MSWWRPSHVGYAVRSKLADLGMGARLFVRDGEGKVFAAPLALVDKEGGR